MCYMVLREILIKIQTTIHFLFALNRKAHKMRVKSQQMQVFVSSCVNSLLIMVLISQSVKEAGKLIYCFYSSDRAQQCWSVVLRRYKRQLQLRFINTPTDTCSGASCSWAGQHRVLFRGLLLAKTFHALWNTEPLYQLFGIPDYFSLKKKVRLFFYDS